MGQLTSHLGLSVHTDLPVDHFNGLIYEMRKEKQQLLRHQLGHVAHVKSEQDVFWECKQTQDSWPRVYHFRHQNVLNAFKHTKLG